MTTSQVIKVDLDNRCYDIVIGSDLIATIGARIAEQLPKARAAIITDSNVAPHYLTTLTNSLQQHQVNTIPVVVDAGEKSKSFAVLQNVVEEVLAAKLERSDVIIALGGGVVGDLAGFVAGIVRRGMHFVQVPTTLLAQVDSSVGGKTGINTAYGKNLVGVFYQPRLVVADTAALDSLPKRQFCAGYAEVVKYGLINQPNFFHWLENNWQAVFSGGAERAQAIAQSCQYKADIVKRDECEKGERALLNLGHTFGHALETATNYDSERLIHGEGVAIGMVLAQQFSQAMNLSSADVTKRVEGHLQAVGLPTALQHIPGQLPDAETLMQLIAQDKKVSHGRLTFILTRGLGQSFIAKDVPSAKVVAFLKQKLADR